MPEQLSLNQIPFFFYKPMVHSLYACYLPPFGLGGLWEGGSLIPRHEHVRGQPDVLVVFGQGEQGTPAGVALWQRQPHVCVFRLSENMQQSAHIYISNSIFQPLFN